MAKKQTKKPKSKFDRFKGIVYLVLFCMNIGALVMWVLQPYLTLMQVFIKYWYLVVINVLMLFVVGYFESRVYTKPLRKNRKR